MASLNSIENAVQALTEQQIKRALQAEGRRLEAIAVKLWRKYLASYNPKKYAEHLTGVAGQRTGNSQRGIKLGKVKRIAPNQWGIELTWENSLMYHESIVEGGKKGHSVMLISEGWHSRKMEQRIGKVYRLTYFGGTGYISKVYKEYMSSAPTGIKLETQWSGKFVQ